jgi:tetratricopeptide (TPR) repeat protein
LKEAQLRILFIALEFSTWKGARSLSYTAQMGLEEGFAANNVEYLTIPAIQGISARFPASWLFHAKQICSNRSFDQVWIELVHSDPGDEFLEWLTEVAPVRVGILLESLQFDEGIYNLHPPLRHREAAVDSRLRYMTHALAVDEADAEELNRKGTVKAIWWPQAVPERYIAAHAKAPGSPEALFGGASYAWRQSILDYPSLSTLLKRIPSPESGTSYPALFDTVNRQCMATLNRSSAVDETMLAGYTDALRAIRRDCFSLWLQKLSAGSAIVNLPGYLQSYPGRVTEGMATGRAVISAEVPDRPRTKELFKNGEEILLFPQDRPEILERQILQLQNEPDFARYLADNAKGKLWRFHTTEKRIAQILNWIKTGQEPCYSGLGDEAFAKESLERFQRLFPAAGISIDELSSSDASELEEISRMVSRAIEQRDIPAAIALLNKAIHLEPLFSEMLMTLCLAIGDTDRAAMYSLVAIANNKPSIGLLIAACEIAEQQDNAASGVGFLKEAFRLNPSQEQFERLLKFNFRGERNI